MGRLEIVTCKDILHTRYVIDDATIWCAVDYVCNRVYVDERNASHFLWYPPIEYLNSEKVIL